LPSRKIAIEQQLSVIGCEPSIIDKLVCSTEGLSFKDISLICNEIVGNASANVPLSILSQNIQETLDFYYEHTYPFFVPKLDNQILENKLNHALEGVEFVVQQLLNPTDVSPLPNVIILEGPGGSKVRTTIAQAIAEKVGKMCFKITASQIASKYQTNFIRGFHDFMFSIAEAKMPAAIIIDEFEQFMGINNPRVLNSLIKEILKECLKINPNLIIFCTSTYLGPILLEDCISCTIQLAQLNSLVRRKIISDIIAGKYYEQAFDKFYLDSLIAKTKGYNPYKLSKLLDKVLLHARRKNRKIQSQD